MPPTPARSSAGRSTPPHQLPGNAWAWQRAARTDPRLRASHLAVLDAYAAHWTQREALVYLSPARLAEWTRLGATTTKAARRQLVAWGWLVLVIPHGRGRSARYALGFPTAFDGSLADPSNPDRPEGERSPSDPSTRGERSPRDPEVLSVLSENQQTSSGAASDPAPRPSPRPGRATASGGAGGGRKRSTEGPIPGPGGPRTGENPAPGVGLPSGAVRPPRARTAAADRQLVGQVAPHALTVAGVGSRIPALAAGMRSVLAGGWSVSELAGELAGGLEGSRDPAAVLLGRLAALDGAPSPSQVAAARREAQAAELAAQRARRDAQAAAEAANAASPEAASKWAQIARSVIHRPRAGQA